MDRRSRHVDRRRGRGRRHVRLEGLPPLQALLRRPGAGLPRPQVRRDVRSGRLRHSPPRRPPSRYRRGPLPVQLVPLPPGDRDPPPPGRAPLLERPRNRPLPGEAPGGHLGPLPRPRITPDPRAGEEVPGRRVWRDPDVRREGGRGRGEEAHLGFEALLARRERRRRQEPDHPSLEHDARAAHRDRPPRGRRQPRPPAPLRRHRGLRGPEGGPRAGSPGGGRAMSAPLPPGAAPAALVVKFGGTSLGTPARILRAAERVAALHRKGRSVVAVVSARGHTTDRILKDLERLGAENAAAALRETDRVLATGEDLSAGLLAATLNTLGVPARSLRGGEAGVRADGDFGTGRIREVDPSPLTELLSAGIVPVVSGFQGERADHETVTLGRGGSDTSAVAIAAALGSTLCDIVTDVDAVYDRDPRRDPSAKAFVELTHEELLDLAVAGSQVVHPEAARLAQRHEVPLRVYAYSAPVSGPRRMTRVVSDRSLSHRAERRKAS